MYSGNQTLKNAAVGHLKISDQSKNITSEQNYIKSEQTRILQ